MEPDESSLKIRKVTWWDGYDYSQTDSLNAVKHSVRTSKSLSDDRSPHTYQWLERGDVNFQDSIEAVLIQSRWSMWEVVLPALGFKIDKLCDFFESLSKFFLDGIQICFIHVTFEFVKPI